MADNAKDRLASLKIGVIGSGLSAVGAIKALKKWGVKPTVLDWGEKLDANRSQQVHHLAGTLPREWKPEERAWLDQNDTLKKKGSIPKKLVFGSDYFYGTSRKEAPVEAVGNMPPFSYALGGLSTGWGAAVLPAQACDLSDWPLEAGELTEYCERVLQGLPYSAAEDGLSLNFPILATAPKSLRLSQASSRLLEALRKASVLRKDETVFGQSRLLLSPDSVEGHSGCRYCGHCMSGCVYKSIYKAGDEIQDWREKGEIDYVAGCLVDRIEEAEGKVTVHYFDGQGKPDQMKFDRVFLAAGAVNSARIVMNSFHFFGEKALLKSRGGFVVPVLSLWKLPSDWPDCNTEPGLFLELKGKALEHWVHVQISTDNELLLKMLGAQTSPRGLLGRLKRFLAGHLFVLLVNYHSDQSGTYELRVSPSPEPGKINSLHSVHRKSFPKLGVLWASGLRLLRVLGRVGCLPLLPFARLNSGSYHVGGTLPMRAKPAGKLETDILGRVSGWKRVHVVDTSVFPSLPGTTIGLLTMANAYRVVDKIDWFEGKA